MWAIVVPAHKHIVLTLNEKEVRDIFNNKSLCRVWKEPPLILLNASTQLESAPSPLPRVTKGIEVLRGCHGRLLHTAVPAPWKWSYAPCQLCFVSPPPPELSHFTALLCGRAAGGIRGGNRGTIPIQPWQREQIWLVDELFLLCIIIQRGLKSPDIQPSTAPSPMNPQS